MPFVPEVPRDLVHPFQPPHQEPLQVQLVGDAKEEVHVQGLVVGGEGAREGPAVERLQHRGVHLQEPAVVEGVPERADHPRPHPEDALGVLVHDEIQVAAAVTGLGVAETVPLLGQGLQALGQEGERVDLDGEFPGPGAEHRPLDPHQVPQVQELHRAVGRLPHHVQLHVDLHPPRAILEVGEGGLAVAADGHQPAGHRDRLAGRFQGLGGGQDILGVMGHRVGVGIRIHPQGPQGLEVLPALFDLLVAHVRAFSPAKIRSGRGDGPAATSPPPPRGGGSRPPAGPDTGR